MKIRVRCLLLIWLAAFAQLLPSAVAQNAETPMERPQENMTISWKLRQENDLLFLDGSINGKPALFLVDTGAPISIILSDAVKRFGLTTQSVEEDVKNRTKDTPRYVEKIEFSKSVIGQDNFRFTLPIDNLQVFNLPKNSPLKFDGVLGLTVFQEYTSRIDYVTPALHFYLRDAPPEPSNALTLPFPKDAHRVFVPVRMNNVVYPLIVDTGFSGAINFRRYTLGENKIPDWYYEVGDSRSFTAYGIKRTQLRLIPELTFGEANGSVEWNDTIGLFPLPDDKTPPDESDESLIGSVLLKNFDIIFYPKAEKVYLVKNKYYTERWYDRAFGIVTRDEQGARVVTEVRTGSRAARGGLRVGDTITEYMGKPAAQLTDPRRKIGFISSVDDEISIRVMPAISKYPFTLRMTYHPIY